MPSTPTISPLRSLVWHSRHWCATPRAAFLMCYFHCLVYDSIMVWRHTFTTRHCRMALLTNYFDCFCRFHLSDRCVPRMFCNGRADCGRAERLSEYIISFLCKRSEADCCAPLRYCAKHFNNNTQCGVAEANSFRHQNNTVRLEIRVLN